MSVHLHFPCFTPSFAYSLIHSFLPISKREKKKKSQSRNSLTSQPSIADSLRQLRKQTAKPNPTQPHTSHHFYGQPKPGSSLTSFSFLFPNQRAPPSPFAFCLGCLFLVFLVLAMRLRYLDGQSRSDVSPPALFSFLLPPPFQHTVFAPVNSDNKQECDRCALANESAHQCTSNAQSSSRAALLRSALFCTALFCTAPNYSLNCLEHTSIHSVEREGERKRPRGNYLPLCPCLSCSSCFNSLSRVQRKFDIPYLMLSSVASMARIKYLHPRF